MAPEVEAAHRIAVYGSRVADRQLADDVAAWRLKATETFARWYTHDSKATDAEVLFALREARLEMSERIGQQIKDLRRQGLTANKTD